MKFLVALVALVALVTLVALAGCGAGSTEAVSQRDCAQLRDHLVELGLETATADRDQHRAALRASFGEGFIAGCVHDVTRGQLDCALSSKTSEAYYACHEP